MLREKKKTDITLVSGGNGFTALEIIVSANNNFYEYRYQVHCGLVSTTKIDNVENHLHYDEIKRKLSYYESMKSHILYDFLLSLPQLEYKSSVGGRTSNGTFILDLNKLNSGEALGFENPLEEILVKKIIKKVYYSNGKTYIPAITTKMVKFLLGREVHFGGVVTDPSKIELYSGDRENIADEAIDMDFILYMSKYVGLKEATLLQMVEAYKPKIEPKPFKAKRRKRRRR